MLLAVEAAARAGFRYTENLDGLGEGDEPCDEMLTFLLASESMASRNLSFLEKPNKERGRRF